MMPVHQSTRGQSDREGTTFCYTLRYDGMRHVPYLSLSLSLALLGFVHIQVSNSTPTASAELNKNKNTKTEKSL